MFGIQRQPSDPNRSVDLDDLNVRKYGESLRRIFFPVWEDAAHWGFRLNTANPSVTTIDGTDQPWAWVCDFERKTITLAIDHFEEKDLLRAVIITQIALARNGADAADLWVEELIRVRNIAETIGRERLANYLNAILDMAEMNVIDMRVSSDNRRVETFLPSDEQVGGGAAQSATRAFSDSLAVDVKRRQHGQASAAIKRLGLK